MGRKSKDNTDNVRVLGGSNNQGPTEETGSSSTGNKEKRRRVVLGADVSTSVIGLCCIDVETEKVVFLDSIRMNKAKMKDWDRFDKSDFFVQELNKIVTDNDFQVVASFIESANMAFAMNRSSANTLFALARFNELVSFNLYKALGAKPAGIGVRTARKRVGIVVDNKNKQIPGKTQVLNQVMKLIPDDGEAIVWTTHVAKSGARVGEVVLDKDNEDKADSFVIAKAGFYEYQRTTRSKK